MRAIEMSMGAEALRVSADYVIIRVAPGEDPPLSIDIEGEFTPAQLRRIADAADEEASRDQIGGRSR